MIRACMVIVILLLGPAAAVAEQYQVLPTQILKKTSPAQIIYSALVLDNVAPKVVFCTAIFESGAIVSAGCVSKTKFAKFVIPPSADLTAAAKNLEPPVGGVFPSLDASIWYLNQKTGDVQFCNAAVNLPNPGCVAINWKQVPD
ncbi:hypothetical protein [Bradyrhizobium elkanii]|uniref:hypothetical protein n=1 Tax=Bradyrhizobium elkanii TaxID=29448 RepID=UPI002225EE16|nr:hypothetical protein [Bradyrhizobium elkanii]MCW2114419.1 hypothetical protein [Bradyrhizobium elkanii]